MKINRLFITLLLLVASMAFAKAQTAADGRLIVGAERFDQYLKTIQHRHVALVVNQTSVVGYGAGERNLVDTLKSLGVDIVTIFTPEHGFRGTADAGEEVKDGKDAKTGIRIVSLYGNNKKPTPQQMQGVDIVLFDLQDVGARFYTYISTMHYIMEACAEAKVQLVVLDRPNPNGFYVDGPVLEDKYRSFVGMDPVPVVHGMTVGEYAQMIKGEGWLPNGLTCNLSVVPCLNYDHEVLYRPRIKPSPNLPNITSIYLYPSLCFFEGTVVSLGRGTDKPFQIYGHPDMKHGAFSFVPESREGAKDPPLKGKTCYGYDLSNTDKSFFVQRRTIDLQWLIMAYTQLKRTNQPFFTDYFEKLAGTATLRQQIEDGKTEKEIRDSWQPALQVFMDIRAKYLLYRDFNR